MAERPFQIQTGGFYRARFVHAECGQGHGQVLDHPEFSFQINALEPKMKN
jgi:hypothetical protein